MCGQLLPTTERLARTGELTGPAATHCLATLAQLLTGAAPGSSPQQQQAAHSSTLADAQAAAIYVDAAVQLLIAAKRPASARHTRQAACGDEDNRPVAIVLQEGCCMLGTQQHLLPLLQTLQQHSPCGMVRWAGYCCHLLQDTAGNAAKRQGLSSSVLNVLAFAPKLLPSLWDWLARTAGLPLEAPLQASRGLDIAGWRMAAVAVRSSTPCMHACLHACLHPCRQAIRTCACWQAQVDRQWHKPHLPYAFFCCYCAHAAVSRGPEGLPQSVALVMGIFCRCALCAGKGLACVWCLHDGHVSYRCQQAHVQCDAHAEQHIDRGCECTWHAPVLLLWPCCRSLAQLLLVLDDGDLHQRQTPFSLGASRAIASTLNSLVFHTAFPEQAGGQQQQQPGQHVKQQAGLLQEVKMDVLPSTLGHGLVRLQWVAF